MQRSEVLINEYLLPATHVLVFLYSIFSNLKRWIIFQRQPVLEIKSKPDGRIKFFQTKNAHCVDRFENFSLNLRTLSISENY